MRYGLKNETVKIYFMQQKIKILFFGHDYIGGQFLQEIMEKHSDKFEVVGVATNLKAPKLSLNKKVKKVKILLRKKLFLRELREKILLGDIINRKALKNSPPVYQDIKAKAVAEQYKIPVFDSSEVYTRNVSKIDGFGADYIVIASFGRIPEEIYSNKPASVINFHPSFLPELRGSCPAYTALIKKMTQTGFSFHLLSRKFDAGPLLYQEQIPIDLNITCRQLDIGIARAGANKLYDLLKQMKDGIGSPIDVTNRKVTHCFRSYEISAKLNPLTSTTNEIQQQIKACTSWSLGSTYLRVGYRHFYIIEAEPVHTDDLFLKKNIIYINNYGLLMKTADGIMVIKQVYYKRRYFSGAELMQLKGLLF